VLKGTSIQKWDAGAPLTATARSKLHRLPKPTQAFSCAEVRADAYPLTFKLYAAGALKHTQTVATGEPFRLPGGYYAQDIQIEIVTNKPVQGVMLAHSMQEMAAL
jgi:predicted ATP-dependent protease